MMAAEKRQFDFENSRSVKPNITSMLNIRISDTGLCSFCYWRIGPYNLPLLFILGLGVLFVLYNLLLHSLITDQLSGKVHGLFIVVTSCFIVVVSLTNFQENVLNIVKDS